MRSRSREIRNEIPAKNSTEAKNTVVKTYSSAWSRARRAVLDELVCGRLEFGGTLGLGLGVLGHVQRRGDRNRVVERVLCQPHLERGAQLVLEVGGVEVGERLVARGLEIEPPLEVGESRTRFSPARITARVDLACDASAMAKLCASRPLQRAA